MTDEVVGRALREPALVSDQAPAGLDPSGFDPARIERACKALDAILDEASYSENWQDYLRRCVLAVASELEGLNHGAH